MCTKPWRALRGEVAARVDEDLGAEPGDLLGGDRGEVAAG